MASELTPGTNYFESFTDGEGGGASNFFVYAVNLDVNFASIRSSVNALISEVRGVQGPNQLLPLDILQLNDAAGVGSTPDILIGVASYAPSFISTTQLDIAPGTAIVGGSRSSQGGIFSLSPVLGTDDGGTDWAYVALDINGAPSINTVPGSRTLDIWRIEVNGAGTAFVDNIEKVGIWQYGIDGDAWVLMSDATSLGGSTFPNVLTDEPATRMNRTERLLSGYVTDLQATPATIGPVFVAGGTAAAPGLALSDGAGVFDAATGIYWIGANRLPFSTNGVKRGEFDPNGNLDLDTNARVKGIRAASQTIPDSTPTLIDFDGTDDFDQGNGSNTWHDAGSGTLSDREEFTCPTGCDGVYEVGLDFEFEPPGNAWDLYIEITLNASKIAAQRRSDTSYEGQVTWKGEIAATDVLRGRVTTIDGGGPVSLDLDAASLAIVKVA